MSYLGDFKAGATVRFKFSTNAASGARTDPSNAWEAADVRVYKGDSTTERSSTAGFTVTSTFDSMTGITHVAIDLSDNTDAGFYAAGNDYSVVLYPDETVDSVNVAAVIAEFSIENRANSFRVALTEGYATDGAAPTAEQFLFMIWSALQEFSISGTTLTSKKLDGSTTAMTWTLNDASNPTSRTRAS